MTEALQPILDWIVAQMAAYGYLIVFLATLLENIFVIGSFTPGETIIAAAAFTTVQEPDSIGLPGVFIAAVLGTVIGANISYILGRRGGEEMLLRFGGRMGFDETTLHAGEEYFELHGNKTILLARFVAVFKNITPSIAGASRMKIWVFEAYTLLGAVIYTTLMMVLGRFLGENVGVALRILAGIGWGGFAIVVGLIVAALYGRRRYAKRKIALLDEVHEIERTVKEGTGDAGPTASDTGGPSDER